MLERRHISRRTGSSGTGRRATDNSTIAPLQITKPGAGVQEHVVLIGCRNTVTATMARFLKLWAGQRLDVTLVEPDGRVASDSRSYPYDRRNLASRYGVHVIGATIAAIDPLGRELILGDGSQIAYDRLAVAPGARLR